MFELRGALINFCVQAAEVFIVHLRFFGNVLKVIKRFQRVVTFKIVFRGEGLHSVGKLLLIFFHRGNSARHLFSLIILPTDITQLGYGLSEGFREDCIPK